MERRLALLFVIVLFLISSCSDVTVCSTPNILYKGKCCLDSNEDQICDDQQDLPAQEPRAAPQLAQVEHKTPEPAVISNPALPEVTAQVSNNRELIDDDPNKGFEDAAVVFVHFGNFQNSLSQRFTQEILSQLETIYGDDILYVFRDLPEDSLAFSQQASEASQCAHEQGKYWEYHNALFANSARLRENELETYAEDVGLDVNKFKTCYDTRRYEEEVLHDKQDGLNEGVSVVPTFFINNKKIWGYHSFEAVKELVDEAYLFETGLPYKREKRVHATSKNENAALIKAGPAVFDSTIQVSPYSNNVDVITATFSASGTDKTRKDSYQSEDTAEVTIEFTVYDEQVRDNFDYEIKLNKLNTEGVIHPYFGGVAVDIMINGYSGIGTSLLPKTKAHLVIWADFDVYKEGQLIHEGLPGNFVVNRGIRDANKRLLQKADNTNVQAYFLLSGPENGEFIQGLDVDFLYFFWDDLMLRVL